MIEGEISKIFATLALGFVLGMEHALDADHLVAVSTIVSHNKSLKKSSVLGAIWGLGHTSTLFIVGMLVIMFKLTIPEMLALSVEALVGIVLIVLGISVILDIKKHRKVHFHSHEHDGKKHAHFHSHENNNEHSHAHKSFFVGALHGLAGSAALMLLVLSTIDNWIFALLYILIFGIGSVGGMMAMSILISMPFVLTAKRFSNINDAIRYISGVFSVLFGIYLIIEIGFIKGLFFLI